MTAPDPAPICGPEEQRAYFRAVNLLNEKWVLHILSVLMRGPTGFNEMARMAQQVNSTTLSQRLQLLEAEGLVARTVLGTIPPKTSYALTEKGLALRPVLTAIRDWAVEHLEAAEASCQPTAPEKPAAAGKPAKKRAARAVR